MAPVKGLRIDEGLLSFDFKPSIGIVAKGVATFGVNVKSFREPLKRIVQQVMAPSFRANFDQGGRPDPWEPWSDATIEIMSNMDTPSRAILERSGKLKKTVQQLNIWTITETSASIRTLPQKVWYGYLHQSGFTVQMPGGNQVGQRVAGVFISGASFNIPARPFIMIQDEDYDAIERVFSKWLDERLLAAGLL